MPFTLDDIKNKIKSEDNDPAPAFPKRKRGRPRKKKPEPVPEPEPDLSEADAEYDTEHGLNNQVKGRLSDMKQSLLNFMGRGFAIPKDLDNEEDDDEIKYQAMLEFQEEHRQALAHELSQHALANPNILKDYNNSSLMKINKMSIEELESRLLVAKSSIANNMNDSISNITLNVLNMVVGRSLGCIDELKHETEKNHELRNSVKQYLGGQILFKMPPLLKIGALYASDVITAKNKAIKQTG